MKIIEAMLTENSCYKLGKKLKVQGLMLHSIGTPQPRAEVFARGWNDPAKEVAVHGFIDGLTGEVKVAILAALAQEPGFNLANVTNVSIRKI